MGHNKNKWDKSIRNTWGYFTMRNRYRNCCIHIPISLMDSQSTGLQQKRVYTSLGRLKLILCFVSARTYIYLCSRLMLARTIRWYSSQLWCTHWGQEEPKLVYTLFCCKLVKVGLVSQYIGREFPHYSCHDLYAIFEKKNLDNDILMGAN